MPPNTAAAETAFSAAEARAAAATVLKSEKKHASDFEWSYTAEPHASRNRLIKAAHPEVEALMGPDPMLKWKVTVAVSIQVFMAWLVSGMSWPWVVALAYCVGGMINHSMTLAMHEVSHGLAFKTRRYNTPFGMFTNLPLGIPSFISFRKYHMEHHKYQGEDGIDADIPTATEGALFTCAWKKVIWVLLQPAFYALRPIMVVPKTPRLGEEGLNWLVQVSFDLAIYYAFGGKGLTYLLIGTLLGMGLHPMAGHFIAEHYTFRPGQETYSYYGPLNWFSFNVGYHNEHHDFPFIPGSRLPMLRALAPEYYDGLPHHTSWVMVIYKYITNPQIGPFSRVKRATLSVEDVTELRGEGLVEPVGSGHEGAGKSKRA